MGVFEFIIVLVVISTIGKVISSRQVTPKLPPASLPRAETLHLQESVDQLSARLEKLEEERDFYRALPDPPDQRASFPPSQAEQAPSSEEPGSQSS